MACPRVAQEEVLGPGGGSAPSSGPSMRPPTEEERALPQEDRMTGARGGRPAAPASSGALEDCGHIPGLPSHQRPHSPRLCPKVRGPWRGQPTGGGGRGPLC